MLDEVLGHHVKAGPERHEGHRLLAEDRIGLPDDRGLEHRGDGMEAEYLPPGHPPTYDMQIDIDALKAQWAARPADTVIPLGRDVSAEPLRVDERNPA